MQDIIGFLYWLGSILLKILLFIPALCQGIKLSAQSRKLGDYLFSLASGNDTWGNKLIAPHANKYFVKPGGRRYGKNEHISLTMAINKRDGFNTEIADKWERRINFFDKDHLNKTLKNYKDNEL